MINSVTNEIREEVISMNGDERDLDETLADAFENGAEADSLEEARDNAFNERD